ncbi:MAG: hypothetical protein ACKVW3_16645 [Phycisphaerales bacterium]
MARDITQSTFKFDRETEQAIERLKLHFKAPTKTDVVRKALALLDMARRIQEEGGDLARMNGDRSVDRLVIL